MKTYVFVKKDEFNDETYLQPTGHFSKNIRTAKKYDVNFWIEVLKILLQLLGLFGVGKLKRIK